MKLDYDQREDSLYKTTCWYLEYLVPLNFTFPQSPARRHKVLLIWRGCGVFDRGFNVKRLQNILNPV